MKNQPMQWYHLLLSAVFISIFTTGAFWAYMEFTYEEPTDISMLIIFFLSQVISLTLVSLYSNRKNITVGKPSENK
jgi:hypothetical protein